MHPLIPRSVLAFAVFAVATGTPLAKQLNLQPPMLTPRMAPRECPPSMVGTWPNCVVIIQPHIAKNFCVWRENNGTPFGIGGNCPMPDNSAVGAPCTCTHTVEHKIIVHHGTVVAARPPGQPSTVH